MGMRRGSLLLFALLVPQLVRSEPYEAIRELITREVRARHPHLVRVEVHGVKVSPEPLLGGRLKVLEGPERPFGRVTFTLLLEGQGRTQRVYATCEVRAWAPVVKAKRPIARHQPIRAEDLAVEELEVSRLGGFFFSPEGLQGKRAKTWITAGSVIRPEQVEDLPQVRKGERVMVVLEMPSLSVTCHGLSLEDGRLGDKVKVKVLASEKVLCGEVVDEGTVRLLRP